MKLVNEVLAYNIGMDLQEMGCGLDWAGPGQGWVAEACECSNEPLGSIKCKEACVMRSVACLNVQAANEKQKSQI